ncbi:MAG: hypothetical protein A2445_00300 [Candidatus Jacksonbacteria bacterium RIFOXYC2_FULL_44_29]|nr:MAG: hypothetical protein UW45_C0057G0001 [Parcubacteria group bacterium GW2011_GWC2_44_22]OGY75789.1 MAG: hypothetical protein A2240_00005 [Candidatus Jacksonbacteria bacterium RIFOXYA2_FULL_43_12]OGY76407.1 MAG: hypothetical protein A2295_06185 [Candidatus Jacksonbacteria bacterium RIFOXYB2_FULL_44_15]OGY79697.1 MAG: hypothetical protein A2445_00300 [Candidatus Jacksonbacteria bacterium RIFOXYC2_FULL_44_29]HBH46799.1 hypothetical protein [Candidatus Jacksonbacteria bacterium]
MTITINNPFASLLVIANILGVITIVNLILAWRIWVSNKKHLVNIHYALSVLMTALWTFAMMEVRIVHDSVALSLFARLLYFAPPLIAFFFWFFTYYFPFKSFQISRWQFASLLAGTVLTLIISAAPDVLIASRVQPERWFKPEISVFWNIIYAVIFITIMLSSFRNLLYKYRRSDGIWRIRLRQVIIATSVAASGGIVFSFNKIPRQLAARRQYSIKSM